MKRQFYVTQYAAIFNKENRLILLRDACHDAIKGKWIMPGGHIDEDKDAISALAREIIDETGLKVSSAWVFKTVIKKYPDGDWRYVVYYVCQAKGSVRLSKEHDAFDWVDQMKAKKLIFRDREEKQLIFDLLGRKVKK